MEVCLNSWGTCHVVTFGEEPKDDHECDADVILHRDHAGEIVWYQHEGSCRCRQCGETSNELWVLTVGNHGEINWLEPFQMYPNFDGEAVLVICRPSVRSAVTRGRATVPTCSLLKASGINVMHNLAISRNTNVDVARNVNVTGC